MLKRTIEAPYAAFAWGAAGIIALLYVVPVTGLVLLSFGIPGTPGVTAYVDLAQSNAIRHIVWTTVRIAVICTILAVALGYVISLCICHLQGGARSVLLAAIVIPFWISALIRAMGWVMLLNNNGLVNSALLSMGIIENPLSMARSEFGVVVAIVHFCVPFAVFPIIGAMDAMDRRYIMAARSVGATRFQIWRDIHLPITTPAIASAAFLVFVLCLGFFVTPAIVGGGRVVMVSEYISVSILITLRWAAGAALSVVVFVATMAFVGVMARIVGLKRLVEIG